MKHTGHHKSIKRKSSVTTLCFAITMLLSSMTFPSCSKSDEPLPVPDDGIYQSSVLLYAVASNNLAYDFKQDMAELLQGARQVDLSQSDIWVYSLTNNDSPTLSHLVADKFGNPELVTVLEYDREKFSTDPARISAVIEDYLTLSPAHKRGMIFWSHATGWTPYFSDHTLPVATKASLAPSGMVDSTPTGWYGADGYDGKYDYCDLLELDEAIPADTFDFLWFDCCYMSAIEVLYQLRDKASHIVAYPTEVAAEGMPYQVTTPYIVSPEFRLVEGAEAMAQYFLDKGVSMTVAVVDTSKLPALAAAAELAVKGDRVGRTVLQKYSRSPNGPFYDFGQYTRTWGESLGADWDGARFQSALDDVVIYKAASDRGFDGRPIVKENFSGISCHYFEDYGTDESEYYKTLDWFRDVYTTIPEY